MECSGPHEKKGGKVWSVDGRGCNVVCDNRSLPYAAVSCAIHSSNSALLTPPHVYSIGGVVSTAGACATVLLKGRVQV